MQRKVNKRKAKNEARKLLNQFKFQKPPLDIFALLSFIDLECREFDPKNLNLKDTKPDEVSAFIEYSENIVMYNKFHHIHKVRFSIAHEIGHYQLKHRSFPHPINYNAKNPDELEANIFAAELLMPDYLIKKEVINDLDDIGKIAEKFQISPEAAQLRIRLDNTIVGNGYDYIEKRSEPKEYKDFDTTFYSSHFPPDKDFEDDFDNAYDHYSEYTEEDLIDLLNWIERTDEQDSFPEAYRAIKKLVKEYRKS